MEDSLKKLLLYRVLPVFLAAVLIIMGVQLVSNYLEIRSLESEIAEKQEEIREAKRRQQELQQELERLDDPEYLEKLARQRLGLVRPGEELIIPYEVEPEEE